MVENSDKGDEEKPEPEEEVKLLVDDIVRENTDCCSWRGCIELQWAVFSSLV